MKDRKQPKSWDFYEEDYGLYAVLTLFGLIAEKIVMWVCGKPNWTLAIIYTVILGIIILIGALYTKNHKNYDKWFLEFGSLTPDARKKLIAERKQKNFLNKFEKYYDGKAKP